MLQEEKKRLIKLQISQREKLDTFRQYERKLRTVCSNVESILHQPYIKIPVQENSHEHSLF